MIVTSAHPPGGMYNGGPMCNERVILHPCCQYIVNQCEYCSSRRLNSRNLVRDDRIDNNRIAGIIMGKERSGKPRNLNTRVLT